MSAAGPAVTYDPERLSMERSATAFTAADRIGQLAVKINDITDQLQSDHQKAVKSVLAIDKEIYLKNPAKTIKEKERQMNAAVKILDFETAAILRDEIKELVALSRPEAEA